MGMSGLLAQMGLGAAANVGQGIGDRIRKDAALAREKALNDQRFGQAQKLEATRFSNNEAIADKNHGYKLDEQTHDDKLARGRAKDDRAYNEKMGLNKSGKLDPLLEKRVDDLAKQREQWINRLENESLSPEEAQEIKDGINGINSSIERLLYSDSKPTSRLNPEALNTMLTKINGLSPEEQQQGLEEIRAKHGEEIAAQIQGQIKATPTKERKPATGILLEDPSVGGFLKDVFTSDSGDSPAPEAPRKYEHDAVTKRNAGGQGTVFSPPFMNKSVDEIKNQAASNYQNTPREQIVSEASVDAQLLQQRFRGVNTKGFQSEFQGLIEEFGLSDAEAKEVLNRLQQQR